MKRLFALGCSFTHYCWPMWPELLAQEYDETYNLGMPGGGNQIIFYKLMSLQHLILYKKVIQLLFNGQNL